MFSYYLGEWGVFIRELVFWIQAQRQKMLSYLLLHGARLSAEINRVVTGSVEDKRLTLLLPPVKDIQCQRVLHLLIKHKL